MSVSWLSFLIIGVLLAAYEVYLQRIKPAPPDEAPPASGPGDQAAPPVRQRQNLDKSHSQSKEITMPRMLRRAAVLGTTAAVASNRGAARGAAAAQQQDAAAAPPPPVQDEAPAAAAAPAQDPYDELMKLKQLLDAGALTQEEFDAQKQKILGA